MNVHKIHIVNFKSIEELELDFDNIHGFWEVEGVVGSGKTTLGEAILFALFGSLRDKNNIDLVRWGTKRSYIELWCESKGKNLYIKRNNNYSGASPIEVFVNNEPLVFTNKRDIQKQLENDYYDISRLMLETLCIISFNGFQSLSTMNTHATNEFLDQAFGFDVITSYATGCVDARRGDNNKLNQVNMDIISLERQIAAFQAWKDKDEHVDQKMIDTIRESIRVLKEDRDKKQSEYDIKRRELNNEIINHKEKLAEVKAQGLQVKKNIDFILKGVCPTCGAKLDQSHLEEWEKQRKELGDKYRLIQREIDERVNIYNTNDAHQSEIINPINQKIQSQEIQLNHLLDIQKKQQQFSNEITKYQVQLKDANEKRDLVQQDIDQWDELQQILLHDIKDKILSSMIPSINKYISQYITELHLPYIVEFDKSFTCHIQVTSVDDAISIKSLSTGQLKTVDMIIILSVLKVLLSNISFNIVFLDELLSNMDAELRDMMCTMLKKNLDRNQKVFIISHVPLNPEILDGRIHVDLKNGISEYTLSSL